MADGGEEGRCVTEPSGLWEAGRRILWQLVAMMAIILLAKLWLILQFSSPTPFWDQWDGEAAGLYKPYLDGTLSIEHMFAAHNEHRIFWTRLLSLGLLELVGRWEPQVQMAVNAVLHTASVGVLVAWLAASSKPAEAWLIAIVSVVMFAIPFGWENTLAGFQSQFYILALLSTGCLYAGANATPFSPYWWLSVALGIVAFFAMASGVMALVVLAGFYAFEMVKGRRSGRMEYMGLAVLGLVLVALFSLVPTVAHHAPLKAKSIAQYAYTAGKVGAWPISIAISWWVPEWSARVGFRQVVMFVGLAIAINLPLGIVLARYVRGLADAGNTPKAILLLGIWVMLQIASISYARALGATSSRYFDLIAIGTIVNAVALLHLANVAILSVRVWRIITTIWLVVVGVGVVGTCWLALPAEIGQRYEQTLLQTQNMTGFLASGDAKWLADTRYLAVPYPSSERLKEIATDPAVRSILPRAILPAQELAKASPPLWLGSQLSTVARLLLLASAITVLVWTLLTVRSVVRRMGGHRPD